MGIRERVCEGIGAEVEGKKTGKAKEREEGKEIEGEKRKGRRKKEKGNKKRME